jgi:hypothetical protein
LAGAGSSARWSEEITIRADLIGFIHDPGQHTGEKLAKIFNFIIARVGFIKKVINSFFPEV